MTPVIELKHVWFSYDGRRWALMDVTVAVSRGEVVAVVGPNGAGKTTLLKIMGLIYRPTRGSVVVYGTDPWRRPSIELRRRIVYVHERPIMVRGSVYDNIALGLRIRGVNGLEARMRVREVAETLGISELLERSAKHLSTGQAQLIAIARALVVNPDVLLLDEPFANLDDEKREVVANLIAKLARGGKTVIVVSHDRSLLGRIASRWLHVVDGRVVKVDR
jgi:energy-coupling factor transporter ATP-binding protein EcfA2